MANPDRRIDEMRGLRVRRAGPDDLEGVMALALALWPETRDDDHRGHMAALLAGMPLSTLPLVLFVAEEGDPGAAGGSLVGFAEVGLRSHANDCDGRLPVGFLEAWFVTPDRRRAGVGRALVAAGEDWARAQGCWEMASDALLDNQVSQRAHEGRGFALLGRILEFRKPLAPQPPAAESGRRFIVVLGAPNDERGELLPAAHGRAEAALQRFRRSPASGVVLLGGFGAHFNTTTRPFHEYMEAFLTARGLPAAAIVGRLPTATTIDDAAQCAAFFAPRTAAGGGPLHLAIVTSDFHVARAHLLFERAFAGQADIEMVAAPSGLPRDELVRALAHESEAIARLPPA